ncbi:MAG: PIN domain-containing protein [Candidatus Heimdallarchaeaceae archaeon]
MTSRSLKAKAAVVDTGVLLEYLTLDKTKKDSRKYFNYLNSELFQNHNYKQIFISFLTKTELLYISCRIKGWKKAKEYVSSLVNSFIIVSNDEIDELAALIKCKIPIALPDCFNLAIAKIYKIPAYFLEEKELSSQTQRKIITELNIDLHIIQKRA